VVAATPPPPLMYTTQPNGADSATINPAALNSAGMLPILLCHSHCAVLSMIAGRVASSNELSGAPLAAIAQCARLCDPARKA
jgi:hypothetical protein